MRENTEVLAGVIACSVRRRRLELGRVVVHPSRRGVGCEMGRRCRSFGGSLCSHGVQSGAGDGSMHRGDGHPRRGASFRRCNVVEDRMMRASVGAKVVVEDRIKHASVGAKAVVEDRMKRASVSAKAVVEDRMKRASVGAKVVVEDRMKRASVGAKAVVEDRMKRASVGAKVVVEDPMKRAFFGAAKALVDDPTSRTLV
jgi:hypothetical protein